MKTAKRENHEARDGPGQVEAHWTDQCRRKGLATPSRTVTVKHPAQPRERPGLRKLEVASADLLRVSPDSNQMVTRNHFLQAAVIFLLLTSGLCYM